GHRAPDRLSHRDGRYRGDANASRRDRPWRKARERCREQPHRSGSVSSRVSARSPFDTSGTPRLVVLGGLILAIACLYWARIIFIPIALALLATFLLSPVVALLRRTGLHRVAAVVIVIALAVLLVVGVGWVLFSQITALADDLPQYRATIARKIADVQRVGKGGTLQKVEETAQDVMAQIERANPPAKKPLPVVVSAPSPLWQITRIVEPVGGAVFVLLLVVFMLIQQRELRARVVRLFGPDRLAETTRALDEASERISRYLLTQTALNASFGITIAVGLFVLGLPFALTWGVFGALLRFIPYAGAWVAAAIPVFVSLAVFDGWMEPLLIVGLFIVAETIIAFVLEPLFFARSAGVSSIALLISVAFWTWLWGPIGLALAIPLTVWLVVFSHTVKGLEFIGILVDDDARLDQHVIFYQRILAGDDQEAAELVHEAVKAGWDVAAYDSIRVPAVAGGRRDRALGHLSTGGYARVVGWRPGVLHRAMAAGTTQGSGRARHLVKRLRTVCPEIPIVVGCWRLQTASRLRADLCAAGADDVVTTLAQARNDLLRLTPAPERRLEADDDSTDSETERREGLGLVAVRGQS